MRFHTIRWHEDKVILLDQRKLPTQEIYNTYEDYKGVADAIRLMVTRGAPVIGVAAAMGMALGALGIGATLYTEFMTKLRRIGETLLKTRPTAVNLSWAVTRMLRCAERLEGRPVPEIVAQLKAEALAIYAEDAERNRRIGEHGAVLFQEGDRVLTHCNAGALCTAGSYGTALAPLYWAHEHGLRFHVYVDETRPFLQGARLTAWELHRHQIPLTVITDNMAGALMQQGRIDKIIVGADRIAANGDVANKIGTYSLAVLAQHHGIPLYVAAPSSTVDLATATGRDIPIEERPSEEITHLGTTRLTPEGVGVYNPAFDVTPAAFVTAIITESGIHTPPYSESLAG